MAPKKTKAVTDAEALEAQVFGDGANTPLPVTSDDSADEFVGVQDVPADVEAAPAPESAPVGQEERVFGGSVADVARETSTEQTITVPMSVLEQMQRQIAELTKSVNGDDVQDLLSMEARKKLINVTYYSLDDGTQFLVTGMKERVFPNGTRAKVYQDGVDQDKKPIYKAIITVANIETGEEKDIEVIYENFIKLSTPVQTEAVKTNERIVDMTPSEEVVEVASYQQGTGGYVKRQGSGVLVRASVQGKVLDFEVSQNGRTFTVTSDVINIK